MFPEINSARNVDTWRLGYLWYVTWLSLKNTFWININSLWPSDAILWQRYRSNIGSGDGLWSEGTTPLPEPNDNLLSIGPLLTGHQRDIGDARVSGPYIPAGIISTISSTSVLRSDKKHWYTFMFPQIYSARNEWRHNAT